MSKLAVITGADGGMGKEITRAVAEAGYHVIMLCYTLFKGEERKNQMILETGNKEIEVRQVDLSSMASVINVADGLLGRGKHIDLLMNNAGTMSTHLMQTEDGLERTVAVNYVAPFLLTMRLLPLMGKGSRIVNMVSCTYSLGHITSDFFSHGKSGSFWRIPIYSNTKLALWLFTRELSERVKDSGITPGKENPAARGLMSAQKLIVFKHDSVLGNAPANKLFDLVKVEKICDGAPRSFSDYSVIIDKENVPSNVTVEELI